MKKWWWRGLLVLAVGVVVYAALPWYSARQLIEASQQGDIVRMERYIDFPQLRANIKQRLQQELRASMGGTVPKEFDGLFAAGSDLILGPLVVRLISPRGISDLIQGRKEWRELEKALGKEVDSTGVPSAEAGRNPPPTGSDDNVPVEPADAAAEQERQRWQLQRWYFSGLNQIVVVCGNQVDDKKVQLYFERQGIRWRMVDLALTDKNEQER